MRILESAKRKLPALLSKSRTRDFPVLTSRRSVKSCERSSVRWSDSRGIMGSASSISMGSGEVSVGDAVVFVEDFGIVSGGRSEIFRGELIGKQRKKQVEN